MSGPKRYQTKTVKAVRGSSDAAVAKWQARGWELVDQTPGVVRTKLTFRRRAPLVPHPVGLALLVVLLVVVVVAGVLMERDSRSDSRGVDPGSVPASALRLVAVPQPRLMANAVMNPAAQIAPLNTWVRSKASGTIVSATMARIAPAATAVMRATTSGAAPSRRA